jgi:hypothetical protein
VQAAQWLGTDALTLQDHPDGAWWFWRAQAGISAENHAQKQRDKPKGGMGR